MNDTDNVDYFIDENLVPEDQDYLMGVIESDQRLEMILDTIISRASETMQEPIVDGSVSGPGTGTSDSIDAKLSDGEFVFTAKAVEKIGVETLTTLMAAAEADEDIGDILDGIDLKGIKLKRTVGIEGSDKTIEIEETAQERKDEIESRIASLEGMAASA